MAGLNLPRPCWPHQSPVRADCVFVRGRRLISASLLFLLCFCLVGKFMAAFIRLSGGLNTADRTFLQSWLKLCVCSFHTELFSFSSSGVWPADLWLFLVHIKKQQKWWIFVDSLFVSHVAEKPRTKNHEQLWIHRVNTAVTDVLSADGCFSMEAFNQEGKHHVKCLRAARTPVDWQATSGQRETRRETSNKNWRQRLNSNYCKLNCLHLFVISLPSAK